MGLDRSGVAFASAQGSFNPLLLTFIGHCSGQIFSRSLVRNVLHILFARWVGLVDHGGRWSTDCMLLFKVLIALVVVVALRVGPVVGVDVGSQSSRPRSFPLASGSLQDVA